MHLEASVVYTVESPVVSQGLYKVYVRKEKLQCKCVYLASTDHDKQFSLTVCSTTKGLYTAVN